MTINTTTNPHAQDLSRSATSRPKISLQGDSRMNRRRRLAMTGGVTLVLLFLAASPLVDGRIMTASQKRRQTSLVLTSSDTTISGALFEPAGAMSSSSKGPKSKKSSKSSGKSHSSKGPKGAISIDDDSHSIDASMAPEPPLVDGGNETDTSGDDMEPIDNSTSVDQGNDDAVVSGDSEDEVPTLSASSSSDDPNRDDDEGNWYPRPIFSTDSSMTITEPLLSSALVSRKQQTTTTCALNENGFYGQGIGSVYPVKFGYQVIVTDETTEQDIERTIVPALDIVMAEQLLPYLFPEECSRANGSGIRRQLRGRQLQPNGGRITGLSRLNTDVALSNDGATCIGQAADLPCWVVAGSLWVFGENFALPQTVEDYVDLQLQLLMQSNSLNNELVPGVLDVQFVDDGFQTVQPLPTPSPPSGTPPPTIQPTTRAPNLPPITPGPTPTPVTGVPTSMPVTPSPTIVPATPTPTIDTLPGTPTLSPTLNPTASPNIGATIPPATPPTGDGTPTSGTTNPPTNTPTLRPSLPKLTQTPPTGNPPRSEAPQGIDVMEWWMWLLVGVGGALLLIGAWIFYKATCDGGGGGGAQRVTRTSSDVKDGSQATDQADEYVPPGGTDMNEDDDYQPPGTFLTSDDDNGAFVVSDPDEEEEQEETEVEEVEELESYEQSYEEEEDGEYQEEEYQEGESYEEEEEYDEEGVSYEQEGEEGEYVEGEYDDDEEYTEAEESYYEEETVGGDYDTQDSGWGKSY